MTTSIDVLNFWFGPLTKATDFPKERFKLWFVKDPAVDQEIAEKFGDLLEKNLSDWAAKPRGRLAQILVFDQFPRHIYRDSPQAFAWDAQAMQLTLEGIKAGIDKKLFPVERGFFYMPLQHIEDLKIQEASIEAYSQLVEEAPDAVKPFCAEFLKYARLHQEVIVRFGRYPHRNKILGRPSIPEEEEFLKQPGSSF